MNLNEKFVVTLSREIGSGGHSVGKLLAEKLGVRFCDKDLIKGLRERFDLSAYEIEKLKGEKKSWLSDFLQRITPTPKAALLNDPNSIYIREFRPDVDTDDIFKAEAEILRGLADEESCVITGRSGFFILRDCPNKVDVFITAPREQRVEHVMRKQDMNRETAEVIVTEVDKMRENYIKRYAGVSRYDTRNYSLVINMDGITEEQAVNIILEYLGAAK